MKKCQSCNAQLGAGVRFCSSCGNAVTEKSAHKKFNSNPEMTIRNSNSLRSALPFKFETHFAKEASVNNNKKPTLLSRESIRRTLFVVPQSFLSSLEEIFKELGVETAGTLHSPDTSALVSLSQQFIRNAPDGAVKYVCIIGNWSEIPPSAVLNDFMDYDGDDFCKTDAFYGATEEFSSDNPLTSVPDILVGRIPITDRNVVQRILISDPDVVDTRNSFQFGVTAQCWEIASKEIISSFLNVDKSRQQEFKPKDTEVIPRSALLSSPDWTEEDLRKIAFRGPSEPYGLIFFNVHGGADEPNWVGESVDGEIIGIFQPGTIQDFNSAILLSEACYGGALFYDSPSIVEHFFTNGGNTFVGSSTIAYGARAKPLCAADLLAKYFIKSLYEGLTQGEALKLAKLEALTEDPLNVEYGLKTALSFNLFGVPWQTLTRSKASTLSNSGIQRRPANTNESVLNRVRQNHGATSSSSSNAINQIREQYRGRLPPRQREFWVQKDKILSKLQEFRDFYRIMEEINECRGSLENSHMDYVSAGETKSYRLFCKVGNDSRPKSTMLLMINSEGHLTKTLISKGTL